VNRDGIPIGRILGITIRVTWGWLIILGLVIFNLGGTLSGAHPDWGPALTWGLAITAALLFFAAVLVHELGHSMVARTRGIDVDEITLFIFGGVSQIEEQPDSPAGEFLMAILGPLASLVVGTILLALAGVARDPRGAMEDPGATLGQLSPLTTLLLWLGAVNVALAAFNLIPGFPLDGGRMLRSTLWALSGDFELATGIASFVGLSIAVVLVGTGGSMIFGQRVPFLGAGLGNGLTVALLGWFLFMAASQHMGQGPLPGGLGEGEGPGP
jgi:Zn-dependent protease